MGIETVVLSPEGHELFVGAALLDPAVVDDQNPVGGADGAQPVGYRIHTGDDRKFCLATDLGFLSDQAKEALFGCDLV